MLISLTHNAISNVYIYAQCRTGNLKLKCKDLKKKKIEGERKKMLQKSGDELCENILDD